MKRALVLGGGGARGAYQIGVWKALRKLKIDFSIVCGTSVGSLNGILMVQKDFHLGKKLWNNMNFKSVFEKDVLEKYNNCETASDMLQMFSDNFIKHGGTKPSNLEKLLEKYFNSDKFFKSNIDYGLTTYNVSKLKPVKLTKKDLVDKDVLDYAVASSSCFPAFEMKKIGTDKFIDGGVFDNLPINLAIEMGADEVIAVDLCAPGIKEKVQDKNVPITYIKPNNDLGSFLDFSKEQAKPAIRYGYLDTLKAFNQLDGEKFSFKKSVFDKCLKKVDKSLDEHITTIFDFKEDKSTLEEIITLSSYKRLASIKKQGNREMYKKVLESLANVFELNDKIIYNFYSFSFLIWTKFKNVKRLDEDRIKELIKAKKFTSILNRQSIIRYFYDELEASFNEVSRRKNFCRRAIVFPKESLSAIYLYLLKKEMWWLW